MAKPATKRRSSKASSAGDKAKPKSKGPAFGTPEWRKKYGLSSKSKARKAAGDKPRARKA